MNKWPRPPCQADGENCQIEYDTGSFSQDMNPPIIHRQVYCRKCDTRWWLTTQRTREPEWSGPEKGYPSQPFDPFSPGTA